jgi:hypothetical protein
MKKMSVVNQILNNIREELAKPEPSSDRIITHLTDLRIKEEYQSLSDSEFYDIVGETFKLNPDFFMKHIYQEMRFLQTRGRKLYEKINIMEMDKYIIEKFCLYQGEQILYECNGKIGETNPTMKMMSTPTKASVDGRIYVTNYRIIAHGKLSASGGRWWGLGLLDLAIGGMTGGSKRDKSKKGVIEGSTSQELPCYGYQFKTTNHVRLKKKSNGVLYSVIVDKVEDISNLSRVKQVKALVNAMRQVRLTLPSSKKEDINNYYKALCKNVYHTINSFYELHEMELDEKLLRNEFLYRLRKLWDSEEYNQLSDSEYLKIVQEVYNIDPEFFMSMVYPKMMSWTFPSFLNVKSEISEILNE